MASVRGVIKSPLDCWDYEVLLLENGIRALLISTTESTSPPKVKGSDCIQPLLRSFNRMYFGLGPDDIPGYRAPPLKQFRKVGKGLNEETTFKLHLTIGSGSLDDDADLPGLAHFTEHLVFLSSDKYPETEGLATFLEREGGDWNAGTNPAFTTIDINIPGRIVEEALARVVDALANPAWREEDVNREAKSLDSEFWLKIVHDNVQFMQTVRSLANRSHPLGTMSWGNGTTLRTEKGGLSLIQRAQAFHRRVYVPRNIALVLSGNAPLSRLRELLLPFETIEDPDPTGPSPTDALVTKYQGVPPFRREEWNRTLKKPPSLSQNYLLLTWNVNMEDAVQILGRTKALDFLTYLISNNRKGSLSRRLREKGWLREFVFQSDAVGNMINFPTSLFLLFGIQAHLTEEGMRNWKEVARLIVQFFEDIRDCDTNPVELKAAYQEFQFVRATIFHYRSEAAIRSHHSFATTTVTPDKLMDTDWDLFHAFGRFLLQERKEKLDHILIGTLAVEGWDDRIFSLLRQLGDRRNINLMLAGKDRTHNVGGTYFQPHDQNVIKWDCKEWNQLLRGEGEAPFFTLPARNPFAQMAQCGGRFPHGAKTSVIRNSRKLKLVHFPESQPHVMGSSWIKFLIISEEAQGPQSDQRFPLLLMANRCWERILGLELADAFAAIFTWDVDGSCPYLATSLWGPSTSFLDVIATVLDSFRNLERKITPELFLSCKEEVIQEAIYKAHVMGLGNLLHEVLDLHICSTIHVVDRLGSCELDNLIQFLKGMKNAMRLEVEVGGSVKKSNVKQLAEVLEALPFRPRESRQVRVPGVNQRGQVPSKGPWILDFRAPSPFQASHFALHYYQIGTEQELPAGITPSLLAAITWDLQRRFHQWFRVEKQLGYDPKLDMSADHGVYGVAIIGQILAYRCGMEKLDEVMTQFLIIYFKKYVEDATSYEAGLGGVTGFPQAKMKKFFRECLLITGRKLRLLIVHVEGHADAVPKDQRVEGKMEQGPSNIGKKVDVAEFREKLKFYPNPLKEERTDDYEDD